MEINMQLPEIVHILPKNTHTHTHTHTRTHKESYYSLLCPIPLQRSSDLLSVTADFLRLSFVFAKVHILCKPFVLAYRNITKSKFKTHSAQLVVI